jgi:hypothetical protein
LIIKNSRLINCLLLSAVFIASGCGLAKRLMMSSGTDTMNHLLSSVHAQPDPELVRQGLPAFIMLLDGLVHADPDNPDLLRATANAYVAYAQAFLSSEEDEGRAVKLYERAKGYGLQLLRRHDHFVEALDGDSDAYVAVLQDFHQKDVPDLYTAATAWLGWIIANSDSVAALADLSRAIALMERVMELDEAYGGGAAHLTFGIYYSVQPAGAGQDLDKSRHHFERAITLAGAGDLTPRVLYAEFVGKAAMDEAFFTQQLEAILDTDPADWPEKRLTNELAIQRARLLLINKDDYF